MDLADVMQEVADRLDTLQGLQVYAFPPDSVAVPSAVVGYPENVTFDATYGRGMDRMTLPVVLLVGKVSELAARDNLGAYCDGAGERSVKVLLESGTYTAFHTLRVAGIDFDTVTVGVNNYLAAVFTIEISGSGSA